MHTIELMDAATELARELGYGIRREWLGGAQAGRCEFGGRKWIFLDLSLNQLEQLDQLRQALSEAPELSRVSISPVLQAFLGQRRLAA